MSREQDWEAAGCHRACRRRHTYRWGGCAYAVEPEPTLARFELARSEDGEMSGFYESINAEQVAAWLREQGYDVRSPE
jgi:hypothetical protein